LLYGDVDALKLKWAVQEQKIKTVIRVTTYFISILLFNKITDDSVL